MKAIILAAGRGSRMKGSTETIPKCMVELFNKPLIQRAINSLEEAGIAKSDIIIVKGYKKEKIHIKGTIELYNQDWENTNMVCSLVEADQYLSQEPCIICYSDIVFHSSVIKDLINNPNDFALSCYEDFLDLWKLRFDNPLDDMETFKQENGYLTEIGKTPKTIEEVQGQYMGLIKITPSAWENIKNQLNNPTTSFKKPLNKLDMTSLIDHMLSLDTKIAVISSNKLWLECDNENDLELYHTHYQEIKDVIAKK